MQLRTDVNALQLALDARTEQLRGSERAHRVAAAVYAMAGALLRGGAVGSEVAALARDAGGDALVAAAVANLPEAAAGAGAPTVAQLQARWPAVQRAMRVAAALGDEAQPGLLSTALAGVAARLKVRPHFQ